MCGFFLRVLGCGKCIFKDIVALWQVAYQVKYSIFYSYSDQLIKTRIKRTESLKLRLPRMKTRMKTHVYASSAQAVCG